MVRKIVCLLFLIASLYLSVISFVNTSPAEQTLSSIGEADRLWFFSWGIATSLALFLNLGLLADKLNFKGKPRKWFNTVAIIGSSSLLVTVSVVGDHPAQVATHWASGIIFGILGFCCAVCLLIIRRIKTKSRVPYISIAVIGAAIDVFFIVLLGLTALCEITIIIFIESIFLMVNFIRPKINQLDDTEPNLASLTVDEEVEL